MLDRRFPPAVILALAIAAGCRGGNVASRTDAPPVTTVAVSVAPTPSAPVHASPLPPAASATPPASPLEAALRARSHEVLAALARRDFAAVATMIHPSRGVRFSPYSFVDVHADVVLAPRQLAAAAADKRVRTWGTMDGSGKSIDLTFGGYFDRFVWTHDFTGAPKVSVDRALATGNTVDNVADAYPGAHFVELYFPGFDPKYEGMDWESLRLIFEEARSDGGSALWLVGIVHGQWTI